MSSPITISVVGAAACGTGLEELAEAVGAELAQQGARLVCGGRGGVMAAASRGCRRAGGMTVGILPGQDAAQSPPNEYLELALFTGMGQGRNLAVVLSGQAVIAIGGGWGTLSEIALALKHRIPVITLRSFHLQRPDAAPEPLLQRAESAVEAVNQALAMATRTTEPEGGP